jgi:hypothetical protein
MAVCTPHSYAGPKECPYCRIAEMGVEMQRERDAHARTQHWLDEFQGSTAAGTVEAMRLRARIAELEAALAACGLGIARAVAELEQHVLPLCSEEGEIEHAVKRALEALR